MCDIYSQAGTASIMQSFTKELLVRNGNIIYQHGVTDETKHYFVRAITCEQYTNKKGVTVYYSREQALRHYSSFIIRYVSGGRVTQGKKAGDVYERRDGVMLKFRGSPWPPEQTTEQITETAAAIEGIEEAEGESTEEPPRKKTRIEKVKDELAEALEEIASLRAQLANSEATIASLRQRHV